MSDGGGICVVLVFVEFALFGIIDGAIQYFCSFWAVSSSGVFCIVLSSLIRECFCRVSSC